MNKDTVTFEYIYSKPSSWKNKADTLARTAYKLEVDRDKQDNKFVDFSSSPVYYMLIGFALENYYKGAILAKLIKNSQISTNGELESSLKTHDLVNLAKQAGITIEKTQESQLKHITEFTIWKGRYPLPIKASHIGGAMTYHPPKQGQKFHIVTGLELAIPIDDVHKLIEDARANLESNNKKIILH